MKIRNVAIMAATAVGLSYYTSTVINSAYPPPNDNESATWVFDTKLSESSEEVRHAGKEGAIKFIKLNVSEVENADTLTPIVIEARELGYQDEETGSLCTGKLKTDANGNACESSFLPSADWNNKKVQIPFSCQLSKDEIFCLKLSVAKDHNFIPQRVVHGEIVEDL